MSTDRDVATAIAARIAQKLFERTWLPFSPALERAIARAIDATIAAAVEEAVDHVRAELLQSTAFDRELDELTYAAYTGDTVRTTRPLEQQTVQLDPEEAACRTDEERRGLHDFRAWQRRRMPEGGNRYA